MKLTLVENGSGERPAVNSSIPPAVSRRAQKAIQEKDLSLEAAEAKLAFAEAQLRDINHRVDKMEHGNK